MEESSGNHNGIYKCLLKAFTTIFEMISLFSAGTIFFIFEVEICSLVSAITLLLCSKCCGNYLRAETLQGRKLLTEIRLADKIHGFIFNLSSILAGSVQE